MADMDPRLADRTRALYQHIVHSELPASLARFDATEAAARRPRVATFAGVAATAVAVAALVVAGLVTHLGGDGSHTAGPGPAGPTATPVSTPGPTPTVTPGPTPTVTPYATATAAPLAGDGVALTLTGVVTEKVDSTTHVTCTMGVDLSGHALLTVALDTIPADAPPNPSLSIAIPRYRGAYRYPASAVWAADGATAVYFDSNPNVGIFQERYVAVAGAVTVTSATSTTIHGTVSATLHPESGAAGTETVTGTWSCTPG